MKDTRRSFGKNKAVAGVDLQLETGVFGLLGPNGAGKTSLLRMLATVLPPSSGEIVFRGTPDELTAKGEGHGVGDAPLERGYSAVLAEARS